MTLLDRIREREPQPPCLALAANGDRCTRSDPHGPDDIHRRGAHTWGSRNLPPEPRWRAHLRARELTDGSVL